VITVALSEDDAQRYAAMSIWQQLDEVASASRTVVDRPRGSRHPRFPQWVYPLDYGYLAGTASGDGEGIDVWIGSGDPHHVSAIVSTYDPGKRDAEVKVVVGATTSEVHLIAEFYGPQPQSLVVTVRDRA